MTSLQHVPAEKQIADMLTKSLTQPKLITNRAKIMSFVLVGLLAISLSEAFIRGPPLIWKPSHLRPEKGVFTINIEVSLLNNPCRYVNQTRDRATDLTIKRVYGELANLCNHAFKSEYKPAAIKFQELVLTHNRVKRENEADLEPSATSRYLAAFPLVGPMVEDIVSYHNNESAYNLVFSNRKRINKVEKEVANIQGQLHLQKEVNHANIKTLHNLVNVTQELDRRTESVTTISPEVIWKISEIRVNLRESTYYLDKLRFSLLDRKVDLHALKWLSNSTELADMDPRDIEFIGADLGPKHDKVNSVILRFTMPIYSVTEEIQEATPLPWWYDDSTIFVYEGPKYIIKNSELYKSNSNKRSQN